MRRTAEVPVGIDEVTPQWLTSALVHSVTDVRVEQIAQDSGFSSLLYRLHLTGAAMCPPTLIAKLPAQSEARGAMELLGGYRRELAFYQQRRRTRTDGDTAGICRAHGRGLGRLRAAARGPAATGTTPITSRAWRWTGRGCVSSSWPDCTPGRLIRRMPPALELFPSIDTPIVRDLLLPAFAPGWQIYLDHCAGARAGARRALRRAISPNARCGTACADRTRHAAARRHPGRQPVLRWRRA